MRPFLAITILLTLCLAATLSMADCTQGDCFNGQGTWTFSLESDYAGDKYVGEFKYDKFHGKGTYYFANGDKYVGEFKDNKKESSRLFVFAFPPKRK